MATARWEACELYLQQEIDRVLEKEGKPGPESRELSKHISIIFEVDIPARTIEQRIRRRATLVAQGEGQSETPKPTLTPVEATQAYKTKMLERYRDGSSYETLTTELDQRIESFRERIGEMTTCLGELTATKEEIDRLEARMPFTREVIKLLKYALTANYDLIHFDGDKVITWNGNYGMVCETNLGMTASVRGKEFLSLLKRVSGQEITFRGTEHTLFMDGSGKNLRMKKYPDKTPQYPDFAGLEFKEPPADFLEAIEACLPSTSKKINNPLGSLHIINDKIFAFDGRQATEYNLKSGFGGTFTIPKETARFLLDFKPTGFCLADNKIMFVNGNVHIWSRLLVEKYPDLAEYFEREGEEGYSLPLEIANQAIKPYKGEVNYIGVDIKEKEIVLKGDGQENTIEYESPKQTNFLTPPKSLARALGLSTNFAHCGEYLKFQSDKMRHLVPLVVEKPKEEKPKKAKAQTKPKAKKEKPKKAAA